MCFVGALRVPTIGREGRIISFLPFFCEGRCGEWKDASGGLDLNLGETPQFTGRAVATLLSRPELTKARSGKVIVVAN